MKQKMTGLEYEQIVADYLRKHSYTGVKVTKGSGDYGIDVIAHKHGFKYAIQCKYYSSPVGLSAVQEAVAGKAYYGCDKAMVVTNNVFTKAAKDLAKCNEVILMENVIPTESHIGSKSNLKWLKLVVVAFYAFFASSGIYVIFENIKTATVKNILFERIPAVLLLLSPFLIYGAYKIIMPKLKNNIKSISDIIDDRNINRVINPGKPKKFFSVVGEIDEEQKYAQTTEHCGELHNSAITGLPHKFVVEGKTYDIDNINDVRAFPLNFSSFHINGTKYYFNDYFRLCAKFYRDKDYTELANALEEKAVEIETEPLFGQYVKENSKTFIKPPNKKHHSLNIEQKEDIDETEPSYFALQPSSSYSHVSHSYVDPSEVEINLFAYCDIPDGVTDEEFDNTILAAAKELSESRFISSSMVVRLCHCSTKSANDIIASFELEEFIAPVKDNKFQTKWYKWTDEARASVANRTDYR